MEIFLADNPALPIVVALAGASLAALVGRLGPIAIQVVATITFGSILALLLNAVTEPRSTELAALAWLPQAGPIAEQAFRFRLDSVSRAVAFVATVAAAAWGLGRPGGAGAGRSLLLLAAVLSLMLAGDLVALAIGAVTLALAVHFLGVAPARRSTVGTLSLVGLALGPAIAAVETSRLLGPAVSLAAPAPIEPTGLAQAALLAAAVAALGIYPFHARLLGSAAAPADGLPLYGAILAPAGAYLLLRTWALSGGSIDPLLVQGLSTLAILSMALGWSVGLHADDLDGLARGSLMAQAGLLAATALLTSSGGAVASWWLLLSLSFTAVGFGLLLARGGRTQAGSQSGITAAEAVEPTDSNPSVAGSGSLARDAARILWRELRQISVRRWTCLLLFAAPAGIPPLAGFWGLWSAINGAATSGQVGYVALALLAVVLAGLKLGRAGRLARQAWPGPAALFGGGNSPLGAGALLALSGVGLGLAAPLMLDLLGRPLAGSRSLLPLPPDQLGIAGIPEPRALQVGAFGLALLLAALAVAAVVDSTSRRLSPLRSSGLLPGSPGPSGSVPARQAANTLVRSLEPAAVAGPLSLLGGRLAQTWATGATALERRYYVPLALVVSLGLLLLLLE